MRQIVLLAALASLLSSCVTSRSFSPTENATDLSPTGRAAAQYDVEAAEGELAHVEVWSQGAYQAKVNGVDATVLQVNLRVEPEEEEERAYLLKDSLSLDTVNIDQGRLDDLTPLRVDRAELPGGTTQYTAYFQLPEGVSPTDIDSFRLKWRVKAGELTYTQRTPFLRDYPAPYYAYGWGWGYPYYYYAGFYDPFYNPFFYDPFYYYPLAYPLSWRGGLGSSGASAQPVLY